MSARVVSAMAVLVAATLLLACSSGVGLSPTAPAAPPAPRAPTGTGSAGGVCYLVSDAEIATLMEKEPIGGGSGFELGGIRFCNWVLYLDPPETIGMTVSRGEAFEEGRLGGETSVSGIGDEAYWNDGLSTLTVRKGAYTITVSVTAPFDPKTVAMVVARTAASRLP